MISLVYRGDPKSSSYHGTRSEVLVRSPIYRFAKPLAGITEATHARVIQISNMKEKTYTLEEFLTVTAQDIEEQVKILETNLRERWRGSRANLSIR